MQQAYLRVYELHRRHARFVPTSMAQAPELCRQILEGDHCSQVLQVSASTVTSHDHLIMILLLRVPTRSAATSRQKLYCTSCHMWSSLGTQAQQRGPSEMSLQLHMDALALRADAMSSCDARFVRMACLAHNPGSAVF